MSIPKIDHLEVPVFRWFVYQCSPIHLFAAALAGPQPLGCPQCGTIVEPLGILDVPTKAAAMISIEAAPMPAVARAKVKEPVEPYLLTWLNQQRGPFDLGAALLGCTKAGWRYDAGAVTKKKKIRDALNGLPEGSFARTGKGPRSSWRMLKRVTEGER